MLTHEVIIFGAEPGSSVDGEEGSGVPVFDSPVFAPSIFVNFSCSISK